MTKATRGQALLLAALVLYGATLYWRGYPLVNASEEHAGADFELYQAIVERVRAGEGYYPAAAAELHARGYPTRSVFNWRFPVLAWLLAQLSPRWAALLGLALAGATAGAWWLALRRIFPGKAVPGLGVLLLSGGLMFAAVAEARLVHEFWAGLLLALACACHHLERPRLAWAAGLAAVLIRELALLGVLIALAWYAWRRQWRWAAAWGLVALGVGLLWAGHAQLVAAHLPADARAQSASWFAFGGWHFVLKTALLNWWLLSLTPPAQDLVTAGLFPLALVGWWRMGPPGGTGAAWMVTGYMAAFLCVGQPFNHLWGLLYAPLWPLGLLGWLPRPAAPPITPAN